MVLSDCTAPADWTLRWQVQSWDGQPFAPKEETDGSIKRLVFERTDLAPLEKEGKSPEYYALQPSAAVRLEEWTEGGAKKSAFPTPEALSAWLAGEYAKQAVASPELERTVKEVLATVPDEPEAKARALYEQSPPDALREIRDVVNDEWIWRLPHVVNYAHLRIVLGDESARGDLERLLEQLHDLWGQGVVNVETLYWAGSAELLLGREEAALRYFEDAVRGGWRHSCWASRDWNLTALAGYARFAQVLEQGARSTDA